jgi:predicted ATP-grasp superfamily ATP-dependent carboligase
MPTYGGTLAATRCLGAHGIPITMAGETGLAPARWSRYVSRWVRCPSVQDEDKFFAWLCEFGERNPGHVLYPTCDDLAWLIADRRAELSKHYHLYQPPVSTILHLLDKKALHQACSEVGIATVPTAFPANTDEAVEMAFGFPLLLKPRTQILLDTRSKGILIEQADEMAEAYRGFVDGNRYKATIRAALPGVEQPMLQMFRPHAAESIYSIAGFMGTNEGDIAARASRKILQRPRKLGVGLCFEEAPVDMATLDRLSRLCRKVGYFGVFEAEFVQEGTSFQLIDFNPRFYGQMGFEVARDLPLAYLVWLGALGKHERLTASLAEARTWVEGRGYGYCDRFFLGMVLSLQGVSGAMATAEVERWKQWLRDHVAQSRMIDATDWPRDRLPRVVSALRELAWASLHPRSFMRKTMLDAI